MRSMFGYRKGKVFVISFLCSWLFMSLDRSHSRRLSAGGRACLRLGESLASSVFALPQAMYTGGTATGAYQLGVQHVSLGNTPVGRPKKRPPNTGALLFNSAENSTLFSLLGHDCISLAAGVVQLLKSDPRNPGIWIKAHRGVVSLVKDYDKRAYFLRLYDIYRKQYLWQQMLYKNFHALQPSGCPNLLTFEGDDCVFGLNFSSKEEAYSFKSHLDKRYEQEKKSQEKEKLATSAVQNIPTSTGGSVLLSSGGRSHAVSVPHRTGITSMGTVPNIGGGAWTNFVTINRTKKKSTKKEKKQKIRKEDISNPTNFQHKAHLGWNQDGGFSQETYNYDPMDDSVKAVLRAAGENPERMSKDDLEFSRKFITGYQEVPQAQQPPAPIHYNHPRPFMTSTMTNSATLSPIPPPPPPLVRREGFPVSPISRPPLKPPASSKPPTRPLPQPPGAMNGTTYRPNDVPPPPPPPPPPSSSACSIPVAPSLSSICTTSSPAPPPPPPPPPPPVTYSSSAAPPPPPPPPPSYSSTPNSGAGGGGRASLLSEIQAGVTLKQVTTNANHDNCVTDARDEMMAQIRQGAILKPVDKEEIENRKSIPSTTDVAGIAGALARALEERRRNMRNSDDSESEEEANNNDSEWESD
uniref:WH1 domain-containing protein n=1 Tax=Setaria digitata TaxID=48799 RepID=A0A915PHV9_9BILA